MSHSPPSLRPFHTHTHTRKKHIRSFFEDQVDVNSNFLLQTVDVLLKNEWFEVCSNIVTSVYESLTLPYMQLLGIDEWKDVPHDGRSWKGVRAFFRGKMAELKLKEQELREEETGVGELHADCLKEICVATRRQLSEMAFFDDDRDVDEDDPMLELSPLTNLGCEANMAVLDNILKASGGSQTIPTISNKMVTKKNGYLRSKDFLGRSNEEKIAKWKVGKNSPEVKKAHAVLEEWQASVEHVSVIKVKNSQDNKLKKAGKLVKLVQNCIVHGGPVNIKNVDELLPKLKLEEVLNEIRLLRLTVAPDIRQQRKIKTPTGSKVEKFSLPELQGSIRSAIAPANNVTNSVETLLKSLTTTKADVEIGSKVEKRFNMPITSGLEKGTTSIYKGFVTEKDGTGASAVYKVLYDDGDEEEVYLHELREMLVADVNTSPTSNATGSVETLLSKKPKPPLKKKKRKRASLKSTDPVPALTPRARSSARTSQGTTTVGSMNK